ncbi:hypothetical protein HQ587_06585, partial [bacterium]|nr:hypothetical protein [bacterium]
MQARKTPLVLVAILALLLVNLTVTGEVTVEPVGIPEVIEAGEMIETEIVLTNYGDQDVSFEVDIEEIDLEDDEEQAGPRRDRRSEPDDMGYEWRDDDEDDGPEYAWLDRGDFEDVREWRLGDDANTGAVDLGWTFPFWDDEYDRIYGDTDGYCSFTYAGTRYNIAVANFPVAAQPGALYHSMICGRQVDYLQGTEIWFWTNEQDMAVMWWAGNHQENWQVILQDNGLGVIQWGQGCGDRNAGINEGDGDYGWFLGAYGNGSAVGFGPAGAWLSWVVLTPEEGIIEADDALTVDVLLNAEEMESGVYYSIVTFEFDDPEQPTLSFPVVMSVDDPAYSVSGIISDASENNDDMINDATAASDPYGFRRYSNNEGEWGIPNLPPGDYEITFTAVDFLPTTEVVEIVDEDIELNIALLHSTCLPNEESFFTQLEPGMTEEFALEVHNNGNGPLTYQIERRLLGEANAEPWELRAMYNTEQVVNDNMINGVTFAEEHFFVSGGNNGGNPNMIYIFDNEGEQTGEFEHVHESRYGMRDLTYDGNLIWGSDENILYGYTTDGEHSATLNGEAPSYRSVTWDPVNERFWSADITSDIYATDVNGDHVQTIRRPGDIRVYGLGFWPDDPDGHCLYVFSRGDEIDIAVYKINLANGEAILAAEIDVGGSRPGGIHITNTLDIYSWVLMGIVQSPDRL